MDFIFHKTLGKGYPVVFIHGFCETHEIWSDFATALAENFKVYLIDLPGFGKSALPSEPMTVDKAGSALATWIREERIEQPFIVGHSLGGYVTLSMIEKDPAMYAGFCLFHSTAFADTEEKKANRNKVIEFVNEHGVDPFIETYVPGLFYQKDHPAIALTREIAFQTRKDTLIKYTMAMRDRPSRVPAMRNYDRPVLILGGEFDSIIPAPTLIELSHLAPRTTIHLLKNTGHMGMFENQEDAGKHLKDFLLKAIIK